MSRYLRAFLFAATLSATMQNELPEPPMPPDTIPMGDSAPVPNVDARAPAVVASEAPRLDVKLYRSRPFDPSLGFAPGSRYQSTEDRKPIQTPGFSISVPLK